jgi:hypothetical protein
MMHGPRRPEARPLHTAAKAAAGAAATWLLMAGLPAQAMEVAPLSEREARQMVDVLPDAQPLAPHRAASQPVVLKVHPQPAEPPSERALRLVDGHPGALVLTGLALALWGMRRTRRS